MRCFGCFVFAVCCYSNSLSCFLVLFILYGAHYIFFSVAKQAPVPDPERPDQVAEPGLGLLDVALVGDLARRGRGCDLQGDIVADHDVSLLPGQAHDHHHDLQQVARVLGRAGLDLALALVELCHALLAQEEVDLGLSTGKKMKK